MAWPESSGLRVAVYHRPVSASAVGERLLKVRTGVNRDGLTRRDRGETPPRRRRPFLEVQARYLLAVAILVASCSRALAQADVDAGPSRGVSSPSRSGGASYPVDTRPPKDFFSKKLLRALAREASARVVCRLLGLIDLFPKLRDPDVFYDASCDIVEIISGAPEGKPFHFVWQVERGSRMPPPQSELLVYLKTRKSAPEGLSGLKWIALDAGVMRYTPALRNKVHRPSIRPNK
jgi:hypothetical protein